MAYLCQPGGRGALQSHHVLDSIIITCDLQVHVRLIVRYRICGLQTRTENENVYMYL